MTHEFTQEIDFRTLDVLVAGEATFEIDAEWEEPDFEAVGDTFAQSSPAGWAGEARLVWFDVGDGVPFDRAALSALVGEALIVKAEDHAFSCWTEEEH
jgi:hypothetical protein